MAFQDDANSNEEVELERDILKDSLHEMNSLLDQARQERDTAGQEVGAFRALAVRYKKEYDSLITSRTVKAWLGIRSLLGKKYQRYNDPIPKGNNARVRFASDAAKSLVDNYKGCIADIRDSNGSSYYTKADIKVGIITDDFMYNYYKDAVDLVYLDPITYKQLIDENDLACVLYVSCWRGMGFYNEIEEVTFAHYHGDRGVRLAAEVLEYAHERDIPVVFQTIEDPPHYDRYLPLAKIADCIFTSASEMIPRYIADTDNENVFPLEYGINPMHHNPIGFLKKHVLHADFLEGAVFFAGSFYRHYPKRTADMKILFDGIKKTRAAQLYIADRNYYASDYAWCAFPDEYNSSIVPPFDHTELQKVHKLFDYSINLNTVTDSPTMCAMRVYEVQALGGLLLSNYSLSVSRVFPSVAMVVSENEVPHILHGYTQSDLVTMQLEGIRELLTSYTVFTKLNYVFDKTGIDFRFQGKTLYVICASSPEKDVIDTALRAGVTIKLVERDDARNVLAGVNDGFAMVWNNDTSNRHYLLDLVNACKFVDVDYVDYAQWGDWDCAYDYKKGQPLKENVLFNLANVSAEVILSDDALVDPVGFSIMEPQWTRDTSHTQKELAVIVPVYNSGTYLKGRCLRSLLRSSIFDKMQIYLIDDGSTDGETPRIVKDIASEFDNVVAYYYTDGGSGSAARPRNKGLELCREAWVTYLDPDNEAINDGYATLLHEVVRKDVDFAFGSVSLVTAEKGFAGELTYWKEEGVIANPRDVLEASGFETQSIQACVIKRDFLKRHELTCIEGAIGQDALFFLEMMACAEKAYCSLTPIHISYADKEDSAVIEVGISFFKKSLLLEKVQVEFLRREGLLESYRSLKLAWLMDGWYRAKLNNARYDELPACAQLVRDIWALYDSDEE